MKSLESNLDTPHQWQRLATLTYGGWNGCPDPIIHCVMHHNWQNEFGAEIIGVSSDVIVCIVNNPLHGEEIAIKLAWSQYGYCTDIVDQGCETIANLAATLLNAWVWYFSCGIEGGSFENRSRSHEPISRKRRRSYNFVTFRTCMYLC